MWFMQERSKHTPISEEIMKAKAIEFYQKITKKMILVPAFGGWINLKSGLIFVF